MTHDLSSAANIECGNPPTADDLVQALNVVRRTGCLSVRVLRVLLEVSKDSAKQLVQCLIERRYAAWDDDSQLPATAMVSDEEIRNNEARPRKPASAQPGETMARAAKATGSHRGTEGTENGTEKLKAESSKLKPENDTAPATGSTLPATSSPCIGLFDINDPWPEGSMITLEPRYGASHGPVKLLEVDLEQKAITIRFKGEPTTVTIEEWNRHWATSVQEVVFPRPERAKAESSKPNAESFGRSDEPASGSGLPASDSAAATLPASPGKLPIPRPSDVDLSLIDVVSNVRSADSLFGEDLTKLGDSLATQGQIEAVKLMRLPSGRYRLLDGERRYRAAKAEGLASLRAEVYDEALNDGQILWFQLMTFASRKDLTHGERARGLAAYAAKTSLSVAGIAKALGLGDDDVRKHLAYLKWSPLLQAMVDGGKLSLNKAITVARLPEDRQADMAEHAWLHGLSESVLTERVNAALGKAQPGPLVSGGSQEPAAGSQDAEGAEAETPAIPQRPTPPADNSWKARHVATIGMPKAVSDALVAAGLWCAGLVAKFQETHGVNWTREITGIGEAAQKAVDDAFERLWMPSQEATGSGQQATGGEGPTDEHDQVNQRRAGRVAEAPIKGTKGQTQAERHEQARRDSEAASQFEKVFGVPAKIAANAKETVFSVNASTGFVEASNVDFTVTIAGSPLGVRGSLKLQLHERDARRLYKAAAAAKNRAEKAKPKR
jgi:ParB/RepB/Spo0J family partition protein